MSKRTNARKKESVSANSDGAIIKFPRTRHFLDLGAATRDDLCVPKQDRKLFLSPAVITIEEKVDGANLGFFYDGTAIRAQNRSHWVTAESGKQWQKLGTWVATHEEQLKKLLSPPNSKILYGEWLCVQHTVKYNALPDYFLAFDIFDTKEKKFFSRNRFWGALQRTGIHHVRAIEKSVSFKTQDELVAFLEKQRTPYDTGNGKVEGIYIRRDKGDWLDDRCKLVNKDFIQAVNEDDHWMHKITNFNNVRMDLWLDEQEEETDETAEDASKELNPTIKISDFIIPQILLFVGMQGSGKTTLGQKIVSATEHYPIHKRWSLLTRDNLPQRSKSMFINAVAEQLKCLKSGKIGHLIIDQCNPLRAEREVLLDMCRGFTATIVYFDRNKNECTERALSREAHPTLPKERVHKAVGCIANLMEPPCNTRVKGSPFDVVSAKPVTEADESKVPTVTLRTDAESECYLTYLTKG